MKRRSGSSVSPRSCPPRGSDGPNRSARAREAGQHWGFKRPPATAGVAPPGSVHMRLSVPRHSWPLVLHRQFLCVLAAGDILEKVLLQPQRRVRPLLFALPWKLVLCSTLPTWAYMFIYNEQVGL